GQEKEFGVSEESVDEEKDLNTQTQLSPQTPQKDLSTQTQLSTQTPKHLNTRIESLTYFLEHGRLPKQMEESIEGKSFEEL
ncbi:MAG: hypothetical protein ACPGVB_17585, partial [Chitinophagales bacterium]